MFAPHLIPPLSPALSVVIYILLSCHMKYQLLLMHGFRPHFDCMREEEFLIHSFLKCVTVMTKTPLFSQIPSLISVCCYVHVLNYTTDRA